MGGAHRRGMGREGLRGEEGGEELRGEVRREGLRGERGGA